MPGWFKRLFGGDSVPDLSALRREGVVVIDVRTAAEYQEGHMAGVRHVPLNTLAQQCSGWKKDQPIITICASGMRSAQAAAILRAKGFTRVYNGGGWRRFQADWQAHGSEDPKPL